MKFSKLICRNEYNKTRPLIVLHGFLGKGDNFKFAFSNEKIVRNRDVYLMDLRNHGKSSTFPEFSLKSIHSDLLQFCKEEKLANIDLFGFSVGGRAAMYSALSIEKDEHLYPERILKIGKLIVGDTPPSQIDLSRSHVPEVLKALKKLNLDAAHGSITAAMKLLEPDIPNAMERGFLASNLEIIENGKQLRWKIDLDIFERSLPDILGFPEFPDGVQRHSPTLFLRSVKSNYIKDPDDYLNIRRYFGQSCQIINYEKAGHWIHVEESQKFIDNCAEFLNSDDSI